MFSIIADQRHLDDQIRKLETWGDVLEGGVRDFFDDFDRELRAEADKHSDSGNLAEHIVKVGVRRWGNVIQGMERVRVPYATFANAHNKFLATASRRALKRLGGYLSGAWESHFSTTGRVSRNDAL